MTGSSIVSPDDQRVTFVELFFDLVFVFSVTQVVGLLHHHLDWTGVGQAVLVFWLIWWAWTQFTWTLNASDTTHHGVSIATICATAVVFFMAVSVPEAFSTGAVWFAGSYIVVRLVGLGLQIRTMWEDPSRRDAARTFFLFSMGGLGAVLAGALLGGTLLYALWGLAIVLDLIAAAVAGRREGWDLHPEHFVERHGLFVILALGETLIAAGGVATGADWTDGQFAATILAVAFTCGLWWTYFARRHPEFEHAMKTRSGADQTTMARDVFSLLHFPMIAGIIAYAVAVEEVVAHPAQPLDFAARLALSAGLLLFVGGTALATLRADGHFLRLRVLLVVVTAAVILLVGAPALITLAIAVLGAVVIAAAEQREAGAPA